MNTAPEAESGTTTFHRLETRATRSDSLAAFFDGPQSVLVMADDPAVRRNRLNLLGVLRNQAALLADFERISGALAAPEGCGGPPIAPRWAHHDGKMPPPPCRSLRR